MFSQKLKQLRAEKKLTQEEFAKAIKVSKGAVAMWETGKRTPDTEMLMTISQFFRTTVDELIGNSRDIPEPSNISRIIPSDKIYKIPVFASVSAGFGVYAAEDVVDFLPMVIDNPYDVPDTIGIKVKGNSMYPKIEDGDIIVVRKQESVDSGDVAVLLLDGSEGLVKKVVYGNDWIELHSFNPEYQTRRFDGAEVQRLRVVGKVLKVVKAL